MKDNFDDILKNKWEQFHFPVDEKHRQDMIVLLDNQKRRRTGFLWWWTGLAGVMIAVAIFLFWNEDLRSKNVDLSIQSSPLAGKEVTVQPPVEDNQVIHPVEDGKNVDSKVQEKNAPSSSSSSSSSSSASGPGLSPSSSMSASSSISQKLNPVNNKLKSKKNNSVKNKNTDRAFAEREQNIHAIDPVAQDQNELIAETHFDQKISSTDKQMTGNAIELTSVVQRDEHITLYLPLLDISELEYTTSHDVNAKPISVKRHPVRIFSEAGAGLVFASKPDFTSGWTFNIGGGINYSLSHRTAVALSGGYLLQNGGFDFERTSTVNQLSFGSRSSFHTLTPEKLHFIYAKAGLHHRIQRHLIAVSGRVQYLYGAQGDIILQVSDQFSGSSIDDTRKDVWLKLDGMKRYVFYAEIQYGYQITSKLSLHSGIGYYFTGIEAKDPELATRGFYWNGKYSRLNPFFTINYHLYGTR